MCDLEGLVKAFEVFRCCTESDTILTATAQALTKAGENKKEEMDVTEDSGRIYRPLGQLTEG